MDHQCLPYMFASVEERSHDALEKPCLSVSSSVHIPYMFASVEEHSHDALEYILNCRHVSKGIMTNADMFGGAIQNYRQLTRLSILSMPTSSLEVQHSWRNSILEMLIPTECYHHLRIVTSEL